MMAAISAASGGDTVTLYEQLPRPGAKLLASGGGKCNLTNVLEKMDFIEHFGRQGRFMLPALGNFSSSDLRGFLADRGVVTEVTDGFHVFPQSNRATDVLSALLLECEKLKVKLVFSTPVKELKIENDVVTGIAVGNEVINASKVIIATGGKGYPKLGGLGIGYKLAEQAGHRIIDPVQAMVGLRSVEAWPGNCTGISFANAEVAIDLPKFRKKRCSGEFLFTHQGISGPPVIDLSGDVSLLLKKHSTIPITINLFPDRSVQDWHTEFNHWQSQSGKKHLRNLLSIHMPQAVADALLELVGDAGNLRAAEFKTADRDLLAGLLNSLPLSIKSTEDWNKAMVTRGGVALKKIAPGSLESRLVKGLYFAGEVLDLDGPCGGFNLQWAFSSGFLAGLSQ